MTWKIVRLDGKDFLVESSIKTPLRFPIIHRQKIFVKTRKPFIEHKTMVYPARRIKRIINRKKMTGIEIEHLKGIADKFGLDRDLFDFKSHIDRSLSYRENVGLITKKIKSIIPLPPEQAAREMNIRGDIERGISGLEDKIASGLNGRFRKQLRYLRRIAGRY